MNKCINASNMYRRSNNFHKAYRKVMEPLGEQYDLLPVAVDIILFLANNPGFPTAGDLCKMRLLKPSLVSFHVDKLVDEGYLTRTVAADDRRKITLKLTDKGNEVAQKGQQLQQEFGEKMAQGIAEDKMKLFVECLEKFDSNLEEISVKGI